MASAEQLSLSTNTQVRGYRPDPDEIRAELIAILERVRAGADGDWCPAETRHYRTVFPQMASWLPEDEARRLRLDFASELERLDAA